MNTGSCAGHVGAYSAVDRDGFRVIEARGLRWYQA